ncbi:NADPH-dependent FMN reductase [Streptomyces lycii]|uniref:NAD(P)H-dependent oxidoreductase n=1 Tax=Streptomyces lycii TaxID=2654337 RepID=A0ABQ7FK00_9ACTN|nr:NAD(P)H-dependent oxidoreductase [Streptomyces lycii]KAF4408111.1 NAD(P)H-dependent oxidoreductase [Streptomyces lycii]
MPTPLRVAVIIGSTRRGRAGDAVGRWFLGRVRHRDTVEPAVVDLAEYDFPARHPEVPTRQTAAFTAEIDRAEAFVVVTPEYNRSFPASLKQAIDYAYEEWRAKPVGFVSYGHRSRGLYAVEQLRSVFTELHTVTVRDGVGLDLVYGTPDDEDGHGGGGRNDGGPGGDGRDGGGFPGGEGPGGGDGRHGGDGPARDADALLDQLVWWGLALREARAVRPYVC